MRSLSVRNLLEKKYKVFEFEDEIYKKVFGVVERNGCWIIYGKDKNGKTWYGLLLAHLLSSFEKVLYVSAEQGTGLAFQDSVKRAKLKTNSLLGFVGYVPFDELRTALKSRKSAKVVFIDNCTAYADEMKSAELKNLLLEFRNKLFIFLSHEERNEPNNALAKQIKKYANVIIRVEGLTAHISGRVPGGTIMVDEEKAMLYWGSSI
jgi:archaellum biogenesis ATPase FlaH